ncbi:MAG: C1 family peptidase [Betaproteobacteria bacterium]|nr:C1 family peptidase [Betaproteobacteria bacterium]
MATRKVRSKAGSVAAAPTATVSAPRARRRSAPRNAAEGYARRLFDARPDRVDLRDRAYAPPLRSLPPVWPDDASLARWLPGYIEAGRVDDQQRDGACTGFGLACVVNYLLWTRAIAGGHAGPVAAVSPRMLYELARRYDEWPGEQYDGSSCRGALKGWHKHGVCSAEFWPYRNQAGRAVLLAPQPGWERDAITRPLGVYYRVDRQSVVDLQAAIADIGAVYVSARTHPGWARVAAAPMPRRHADLPLIPLPDPADRQRGGHAFALVGYNEHGFVVQNSWGERWGARGFAVLRYDDWAIHATDAWVCALGVPCEASTERLAGVRWPVGSGRSLSTRDESARNPHNPPDDPWPIDHEFRNPAYHPWSTARAYAHTLVAGNDGVVDVADVTRGVGGDALAYVRDIALARPLAAAVAGAPLRLLVYAHGGLNAEAESIARIRVVAPYLLANGIYPLFLTWKTGPLETLQNVFADQVRAFFGLGAGDRSGALLGIDNEQWDRGVERLARVTVRGLWSEMRENAERGARDGHLLALLAGALAELRTALAATGSALELHLAGHSAGSILLGHLVDRLGRAAGGVRVDSCALFAAACSARFAVAHFVGAPAAVLAPERMFLHHLSEQNEKDDFLVGSAAANLYGKSLLYLVSRALDDERKMPLLGMERALDPAFNSGDYWAERELPLLVRLQAGLAGATRTPVTAPRVRTTRTGESIAAAHGAFDNSVDLLTATITRVTGAPPVTEVEWLDY